MTAVPERVGRMVTPVVVLDGQQWWACPVNGTGCCRISAELMPDDWARDAMDVHVRLDHTSWR